VGTRVPGYGVGAALVCYPADWLGADALLGSIVGSAGGILAGATVCEGGVRDQVVNGWNYLFGRGEVVTIDLQPDEPLTDPISPTLPSSIPGINDASLTCAPGPARETGYKSPRGCGEDMRDLECGYQHLCSELASMARRNLACKFGRIISANTFGRLDPGHEQALRWAQDNYDDCVHILSQVCDEADDFEGDEAAQRENEARAEGMDMICN
jgi:hypothetical protein